MTKTLPDKPSELIRVALRDLELVEKDDKYTVDMHIWHELDDETEICFVCLSGAVMAKTLNLPITDIFYPGNSTNARKLQALNFFREGNIYAAAMCLELPMLSIKERISICPYEENSTQFKTDMLNLASDLEKAGY